MNREEYLQAARKNEIPMTLLLDYYNIFNRNSKLTFSLETFTDIFAQFLTKFAITLEGVRAYYDRLYGITTIYDKSGNFLGIY